MLGQYSSLHCLESLGSSYSHCSCLSTCTLNTVCLCWGHTYSPEAEYMQGTALGSTWMLTAPPLLSYAVSSLCVHPQLKFQDSCGARLLFLILQHRLLASVHLVEHLLSWVASSASSIVSLWIQTSKSSSLLQHAQITQTHSKCLVLKNLSVAQVWNGDEHIILPADGNQNKETWLLVINNSTWNQAHFTQGSNAVATHHLAENYILSTSPPCISS